MKESKVVSFIGGFYIFVGIIVLLSFVFNGSPLNAVFDLPNVPDYIVKLAIALIYIPLGYLYVKKDIIFYNTDTDNIEVMVQDENVWLNSYALVTLFDVKRPAITKHINNIYIEGVLQEKATCSKMEQVRKEGNREVKRNIEHYNLE